MTHHYNNSSNNNNCANTDKSGKWEDNDYECSCCDEVSNMENVNWCCATDRKSALVNYSKVSSGGDMAFTRTLLFRFTLIWRRRIKKSASWKLICFLVVITTLVVLQLYYGYIERLFLETDFRSGFKYSANFPDFKNVVQRFIDVQGDTDTFQPAAINPVYSKVPFLQTIDAVVRASNPGLLIIVKSATRNYKKRSAIRKTWGDPTYLKDNYLTPHSPTKLVFISGIPLGYDGSVEGLFPDEKKFNDIVLADFQDCYGNNTFKTMLALRWAVEYVKTFQYLMIVDDDMYINVENAIAFIRNRDTMRVRLVTSDDSGAKGYYIANQLEENNLDQLEISMKHKPLLSGQLCFDAKPFRSKIGLGSRWALSIDEYPYSYFPPYIAGGATIFDNSTAARIFYGSLFTKHFWVDDVYIGIIAFKLGIILTGNKYMDSSYTGVLNYLNNFDKMIALHGLGCPEQLLQLWHTRNLTSLSSCRNFLSW